MRSEDCHLFPAVVGIRFDEEPVKEKWCNPFAWGWRLVSFFGKRLDTFGRRTIVAGCKRLRLWSEGAFCCLHMSQQSEMNK
jgi:hypothetical protein